MSDYRRGFGLHIGFIDHFNTQLVITFNYSAIADPHTLKVTRTYKLEFSVCYSLHQSFLGNVF
jgi:ethanolamine utilization microcompartment shell protein EutS